MSSQKNILSCCVPEILRGRAFCNIHSGGGIPHQPLSLAHQWSMLALPLKCPFDSATFLFLFHFKYMYTYINFSLYGQYKYFKSAFESLLFCKLCIYLESPFSHAPPVKNPLKIPSLEVNRRTYIKRTCEME